MTHTSQPTDDTSLREEIDRLSLEQALRDFEVANARVMDLTQRLISANDRVVEQQSELDRLRVELAELRSVHEAMRGSMAYRTAEKIWALRNALRG
jgi:chromosome segregation ATPase